MDEITIQQDDPASSGARELIRASDEYMTALYPAESNHLLPVESLKKPGVVFLTATIKGKVAGCGAIVDCGDYAEIKRMFVSSEFRGKRIGDRILKELEARAREKGFTCLRLETGISQPEALSMYKKAGFYFREPFGEYKPDPLSVFMEKIIKEL